jgi:cell division septum initiation protein DivIVA
MDILRILDELNYLAVEKPKKILGFTYGLDQDEVSMQIAKVRASLPAELKQAVQTVRESDRIVESAREDATLTVENAKKEGERIIADARREAELLINQAKLEQERMIGESEVLKLSKAQAEEIRSTAERDANQLRRGADKYAYDVMTHVETVLSRLMTATERGKQEVAKAEPPAIAPKEKIRV